MSVLLVLILALSSCLQSPQLEVQEKETGAIAMTLFPSLETETSPEPPGMIEEAERAPATFEEPNLPGPLILSSPRSKSPRPSLFQTLSPEGPQGNLMERLGWWFKKSEGGPVSWEARFNQIKADGKIPGLRYEAEPNLLNHLKALRQMTRSFIQEPNAERLKLIEHALEYFLIHDKGDPQNWWYPSIGLPQQLGPILVQIKSRLKPSQLQRAIQKLPLLSQQPSFARTGANLLWIGSIQLMRAYLENKSELAREAADFFKRSIVLSPQGEDGLKLDGSFHQHGAMIHNGTYGFYYLQALSEAASIFQGTPLAFEDKALLRLASFTLSSAWMSRGQRWDTSVIGRELTRYLLTSDKLQGTFQNLQRAARNQEPFQALFDEFSDALARNPSQLPELAYSKYFWNSDYYVHHRPHFGVTVRTLSSRTIGTESGNFDNKLGFWLPFGLQLLTSSGREYDSSIFAWNYARLPGVTNPDRLIPFQAFSSSFEVQRQKDSLVFGLSTDGIGLSAMNLGAVHTLLQEPPDGRTTKEQIDLIPVKYKKVWFFTNKAVVTLVQQVSSKDTARVHSTLEQLAAATPPQIANRTVSLDGPTLQTNGRESVRIRDRVFIPLDASKLQVSYSTHKQQWSKLGARSNQNDQTFTEPVAWIRIDHGIRPSSAKAAYLSAILTGSETEKSLRESVVLLSNTPQLASIFLAPEKTTLSAFWQEGSQKTEDFTLNVSKPCAVSLRRQEEGFKVALSAPSSGDIQISLTIGERTKTVTLTLPSGSQLGQTESVPDFERF